MSESILTKICTKCNTVKPRYEFHKAKSFKDGMSYTCKACTKARMIACNHTKKGLATKIYSHQRGVSKRRGHVMPDYTKTQLIDWLNRQINFDYLFLNWLNSGYNTMKIPSVDRLDDYKPYTFDNIRLVTWKENKDKSYADRKNGVNNKHSKAVSQFSLDGEFIKNYHSASQAERQTKLNQSNISKCCLGKVKTHGGYRWEFC